MIIDLIKAGFGIGYATKEFISDELNNKSLYEIKIDNNISKRTIVITTIDKGNQIMKWYNKSRQIKKRAVYFFNLLQYI